MVELVSHFCDVIMTHLDEARMREARVKKKLQHEIDQGCRSEGGGERGGKGGMGLSL